MPNCPYCLEEIKPGARKCPHCQSSLETTANDGGNTVYILDKGLIRFGKFIAATLGIILTIGVYLFGFQLNEAVKKTSEAQIQVERSALAAEKQQAELETKIALVNKTVERIGESETAVIRDRDETRKTLVEAKDLLDQIRSHNVAATGLFVEMQKISLDSSQMVVASIKRTELGIQVDRGTLWKIGSVLRYRFLDGKDKQKNIVRAAINEWTTNVNLTINEVKSDDAELRISFKESGSWSYIGTDALGIPKNQPTINYGTLEATSDAAIASQVALHEFGHALGLQHEFQNPSAGDIFNVQAVYDYYSKNYKWTKDVIDISILTKGGYPGSRPYDPESVMNNSMPASLFVSVEKQTRPGAHLSESDKRYIASLYPRT
jgi:astacin (peptidase family M12A)